MSHSKPSPHNTPDSQPIGSWRDRGECVKVDPEIFFPTSGPSTDEGRLQREAAKRVCARCTVQEICLAYALETNQTEGVWGGLDEDERRAVRRRARRQRDAELGRRAINTRGDVY